jgi:hypothetical protein
MQRDVGRREVRHLLLERMLRGGQIEAHQETLRQLPTSDSHLPHRVARTRG